MRTITHPLSGATYDLTDDGNIAVTKDGQSGTFNRHGQWLAGTIRHADPHLCLWIAGETLGPSTGAPPASAQSPADRRSVARRLAASTGSKSANGPDSGPRSATSTSQEAPR